MSSTLELARPSASTHAPERSLEQRREALLKANRIRSHRAELKRDVKAGRVRFADVLLGFDERGDRELLATMRAFELLLEVPKVGRVKANKAFVQCRVSPSKTLAGMTQRQRCELVSLLRR